MARAGDVVGGKYRLIHPLGIGGMGTVWRAEHQDLRQHVAIKLLDARGPNADRAVRRFQREAQIAASIHHRNIVYISDFGSGGGEPYLVMELLSGVPLSERMVVGEPLGVGAFLRMMEEALLGLSAVHAAGVVHRDMKPENIFLVRSSDGSFFPKLLDFGVSRSTERNQGHTITREGVVMGTPEYVSPEQARGKAADTRSDIYSLGVVIYEALAGRLPFQADNPADLIVSVLNAHPVPLSSFRPDLGEPLSELVQKAMAREPEGRFQHADDMRAALSALRIAQPELEDAWLPRRFITPQVDEGAEGAEADVSGASLDSMLPTAGFTASSQEQRLPMNSPLRSPRAVAAMLFSVVAGLWILFSVFGGSERGASSRAAASAPEVPAQTGPTMRLAPSGTPTDEVLVELFGVPGDAQVTVDGEKVHGSVLRFVRGSGSHAISVEAEGRESFHIEHNAERDGRYAIALAPKAKPQVSKAPRPLASKNGLLRRPDF
jgi:serine/threonine protein kinase